MCIRDRKRSISSSRSRPASRIWSLIEPISTRRSGGSNQRPSCSLSLTKCFDFNIMLKFKLLAKFLERCNTFSKRVMTVNTFFVELFYGNNRVVRQIRKCLDDFVGHNSNAVLDELRILVSSFNDDSFVGSLEQFVNPGAHRLFDDFDNRIEWHLVALADLDRDRPPSSLVVGSKRDIPCLLYTSDAADEEDSVDLGGRRIIKKKKKTKKI